LEVTETTLNPACPNCQAAISTTDSFCGQCGKEIVLKESQEKKGEDVFIVMQPTLLYYFITLLLLATYKFTDFFPDGLEGLVAVTILDVLIVIAFWVHNYKEIKPLFSLSKINFTVLVLTLLGASCLSVIVSVIANFINVTISDDVFYDTYLFQDTSSPLLFATLFIAVQPALFEEVAFRGFLFNNLKRIAGGTSAVYITGFLFGILHLQIISLMWLVPLGLAFAYLRNKYNTIWYGVVAHFTYNLCITLFEFEGWF